MAFTLQQKKRIEKQLKKMVRKELGRASTCLPQQCSDEDVHEGRKSVKKVEAVVNLLKELGSRPPKRHVKRLKSARRALSVVRDAAAMVETFDHLKSRFGDRIDGRTSATIGNHLMRAKATISTEARQDGSLADARKELRNVRRSTRGWRWRSIAVDDLPSVLRESLRDSREAMTYARTRRGEPDFHRWRKRVKRLWYQVRLVEHLIPELSGRVEPLKRLETDLGEEHNLAVLKAILANDAGLAGARADVESLTALAVKFQEELRRSALAKAETIESDLRKTLGRDPHRRAKRKTARAKPSTSAARRSAA